MPTTLTTPDYAGGSLVNLVAELEYRLTGRTASPRLTGHLAAEIPDAPTYVLVVMDGLGSGQLHHPAAATLKRDHVATIDAPFPTTTTVSLATIATGLPPSRHGLLGYQLHLPETIDPTDARRASVINTIKWTRLWGEAVPFDTGPFLPSPNLWERLSASGIEPITVQPQNFQGSSLSRALYRGCRFEAVASVGELIDATVDLASFAGRLVVTYLPQVDFAAHVNGQDSPEYATALSLVDSAWSSLAIRLPSSSTMVGTADHGHVDFPANRQITIPHRDHDNLVLYGDSRAMFVKGDAESLAMTLPATWLPASETEGWWGPEPYHEQFLARRPDGILLAEDDHVILHRHSDDRMRGHHGGLAAAERHIPLIIGSSEGD